MSQYLSCIAEAHGGNHSKVAVAARFPSLDADDLMREDGLPQSGTFSPAAVLTVIAVYLWSPACKGSTRIAMLQAEKCKALLGAQSLSRRENQVRALHHLVSVVILTYNRADELRRTLDHMLVLPEQPDIVVVDNASTDGTAAMVRQHFHDVRLISLPRNTGAAARNAGVQQTRTPYIAFCDDDSWWAPGSLEKAVEILEAYPRIAALCARPLLGPEEKEDPICEVLASSPLPCAGLPGPALLGFIACATVFRRQAFLDAGGYEAKFFVGGEEELLSLDLVSNGWSVVYAPRLTVHHYPSPQRDNAGRQKIVLRNMLWVAWLRLPVASAVRQTWRICRSTRNYRTLAAAFLNALRELPWIWRKRRVISSEVHRLYRTLRG